MRYRAGRFRFEEFSGYVLDHTLDGVRIELSHPVFNLKQGFAFTGLTYIPSSSILVTQSDFFRHSDVSNNGYELTSPKAIETLELTFPNLFFGQNTRFSALLQQDLLPTDDRITENDRIHTFHTGVGIDGAIVPSLYHNIFYYLNLGQGKYDTLAQLFGGGLRYYNEELLYSRVELSGFYSSGDKEQTSFYGGYTGEGTSSHFIGLSSTPELGTVFSPKVGNLNVLELSYSIRPLAETGIRTIEKFQTGIDGLIFFRNTSGSISSGNTNPNSSEGYLGSEVDLTLNYRPFSDLGISLAGGLFFPNDDGSKSALLESEESVETAVRLDVSFSF